MIFQFLICVIASVAKSTSDLNEVYTKSPKYNFKGLHKTKDCITPIFASAYQPLLLARSVAFVGLISDTITQIKHGLSFSFRSWIE